LRKRASIGTGGATPRGPGKESWGENKETGVGKKKEKKPCRPREASNKRKKGRNGGRNRALRGIGGACSMKEGPKKKKRLTLGIGLEPAGGEGTEETCRLKKRTNYRETGKRGGFGRGFGKHRLIKRKKRRGSEL